MKRIRRGRATDAIFDLAISARHHYRSADPSAPKAPRIRMVSANAVRSSFASNKKLTMMHIEPGLFVIVIPNKYAFEHYELIT